MAVVDVMDRLGSVVDELVELDPCGLSDVALAGGLLAVRAEMDRLEAVFAGLAHAGHVRGVGSVDGAASTAAWLRHRAGMREGDAKAAIECGAVCELLPAVGQAWRDGEISSGAARTIAAARVKGFDRELQGSEPVFLKAARARDMKALRVEVAHFRNLARGDGKKPRKLDGLHLSRTFANRSALRGDFGDLDAETIRTALYAYTDPPTLDDPRPTSERMAAALVRICEVALAHLGDEQRTTAHVNVVVDWQTLMDGRLGRSDGGFTGPMHVDDVRKLLCDCSVSRVVTGPRGEVLDVGRSRRTVPPPMRRALVVRDDGCRFPGCDRPPGWCDAHHVVHWSAGGSDRARQSRVALRPTSPRRAPARLDGEVRRRRPTRTQTRRHRAHMTADGYTARGHRRAHGAARRAPDCCGAPDRELARSVRPGPSGGSVPVLRTTPGAAGGPRRGARSGRARGRSALRVPSGASRPRDVPLRARRAVGTGGRCGDPGDVHRERPTRPHAGPPFGAEVVHAERDCRAARCGRSGCRAVGPRLRRSGWR